MKVRLLITIGIMLVTVAAHAQQNKTAAASSPKQTEIYREIRAQDSIFFAVFNRCDTLTYRQFLSANFEFYHDLGGVHYLDEEMQSMREMCQRNSHIRRELLTPSLEVHQMGEDIALEIGEHNFYHTNPGQSEHLSGTYKFIHLWQKQAGRWKLIRVISYGHSNVNNN